MDPTPISPTNKYCNTPDTENETPPAPPPPPQSPPQNKPLFQFTNGAVKNQHQNQNQKHHFNHHPPQIPASAAAIGYKECLKNHAAAMGGHAVDGCGEFMPSPTFNPTDPTSLKCAACGCHRNFHRRDDDDDDYPQSNHPLEFQPRYPALLPPPPIRRSSPFSSPSPPAQPSYYGSAPNMLLALSTAVAEEHPGLTPVTPTAAKSENPSGRKRFRTRFSSEQKEKMHSFSEKLGWKMQKSNEGLVEEFCNEIGVRKGVLKVWMHNNKNTFGRREAMMNSASANGDGRVPIFDSNNGHNNNNMNGHADHKNGVHHPHVSSSGSPSSA